MKDEIIIMKDEIIEEWRMKSSSSLSVRQPSTVLFKINVFVAELFCWSEKKFKKTWKLKNIGNENENIMKFCWS